ncbi:MAG: class I SAM-dependent methyltransferase [Bdellovibrionota bacterium]
MKCPQCANENGNELLYRGVDSDRPKGARLPIVRCGSCSLAFTDPSAIPKEELYYEGYYGEARSESGANKAAVSLFQIERRKLSFGGTTPKRVLDVGCGDGTYLRNLPAGVERYGYEPSDAGRKSLAAYGMTYLEIDSPPAELVGSFDLITLWQSFEHIENPDEVLRKVRALLAPNGTLFLSVPHFASWQAKVFGPRWFHLDPTRHVYHYTKPVLEAVLAKNEFKIDRLSTMSLEYGVFGWWQSLFNLLPMDFNMGFKILKARKKYPRSLSTTASLVVYAVLAIPFAVIGTVMMFVEGLFGRGGVINLRASRR